MTSSYLDLSSPSTPSELRIPEQPIFRAIPVGKSWSFERSLSKIGLFSDVHVSQKRFHNPKKTMTQRKLPSNNNTLGEDITKATGLPIFRSECGRIKCGESRGTDGIDDSLWFISCTSLDPPPKAGKNAKHRTRYSTKSKSAQSSLKEKYSWSRSSTEYVRERAKSASEDTTETAVDDDDDDDLVAPTSSEVHLLGGLEELFAVLDDIDSDGHD